MSQKIQTAVEDCYLKFAEEKDVPLILDFIKGLAGYEKLAHEVEATESHLKKYLFGERRYAEVILAYSDDTPAGFAFFFHNFSTFMGRPGIYLEDLFVRPALRGRGIGMALLSYLAQLTIERDCARLDWSVLDWNKPAIEFYEYLDATPLDDWATYRLSGERLKKVAQLFKEGSI